ncbi:MAG: trypsin-like peptidase domain-containing protein [Gammaproteobacteria bacterium]|nr:trypsin-like peptidase domain-containing protein [Gammaproteobacteria bacterium]
MALHPLMRTLAQAIIVGLLAGLGLLWGLDRTNRPPVATAVAPGSYAPAVAHAAPAVANIYTTKVIVSPTHPLLDDPSFRFFFGLQSPVPKERLQSSLGSGVIIDQAGYLVTNHHVVEGADEIQVALQDGRSAAARIVGTDPDTDIAVLAIELPDLPVIDIAESRLNRVGDVVLAIGNPFGVGQTVTMGIVSATGRNRLGINTFEDFIQTDAAINPGNSGGALINPDGALVGINTAIFSKSGGSQGIGFAVPSRLALAVAQDIIEKGLVERGWLGIEAVDRADLGGALIRRVYPASPAAEAGVNTGDLITAIGGTPVASAYEALNLIARTRPGTRLNLTVVRQHREQTIRISVMQRPAGTVNSTP